MSADGILRYLAECYRENGSRFGLTHLAGTRVRQSLIVEGEDAVASRSVLDGLLFVPGEKAAALANQARLYEKECQLFYGSIFLMGPMEREDLRSGHAFAPLLLYPTSVVTAAEGQGSVPGSSGAEFAIDTSRRLLNDALLESFCARECIERIERCVDESAHTEGCVGEIRRHFGSEFPDAETDGLLRFPHLLSERELKAERKRSEEKEGVHFHLVPASALILVERSTEMRGVLHDLSTMAAAVSPKNLYEEVFSGLSAPAQELLGGAGNVGKSRKKHPERPKGEVPAILSAAQERIAASARSNPLTLAVGPPGTGKSFTIAALAMEAVSRGESVLVVSKMDHAVDVVADKIEETLGLSGICVRAGRRTYLQDLKGFLGNLLSGLHTSEEVFRGDVEKARKDLARSDREIRGAERRLEERGRREERRGKILAMENPGLLSRWRMDRWRKSAADEENLNVLATRVSRFVRERIVDTVGYLALARRYRLQEALRMNRPTFQAFSKAIRARTGYRQDAYFGSVSWGMLLRALPVWLVNLSDLHRILPMERDLFDLVIIDEASQCDIASAMPALQRAKRAVVTGDPKQLRHLSFLPLSRQEEFARRFGLDETDRERFHFRNISLVDLVAEAIEDQDAIVFLNEHFRSRPGIIEFSNREFYDGKLAVMTGHREADHAAGPPLEVFAIGGSRSDKGGNEAEIEAVFSHLEALASPDASSLSIGILSPFRAQVDAIMKRVERHPDLSRLLDRHKLLVGTAHSFQGEERDLMLLSFALDGRSPAASFRFLEKEDVFNVAITRARLENRIFLSFDPTQVPLSLAARYFREAAGLAEKRVGWGA